MTQTFRRHGDAIRATFRDAEVELLRSVQQELRETLESLEQDDSVVQRLFPPPVLGDESIAAEVRDLLTEDLLQRRFEQLDELLTILERGESWRGGVRVDLVDDEPLVVLGVLNDLRLAIGARIDVMAIDREQVDRDHPYAYALAVMDHFGWWQEQLLAIIDPPSVRHTTEGWFDDDVPEAGTEEER